MRLGEYRAISWNASATGGSAWRPVFVRVGILGTVSRDRHVHGNRGWSHKGFRGDEPGGDPREHRDDHDLLSGSRPPRECACL